jgi:hypothetical protein
VVEELESAGATSVKVFGTEGAGFFLNPFADFMAEKVGGTKTKAKTKNRRVGYWVFGRCSYMYAWVCITRGRHGASVFEGNDLIIILAGVVVKEDFDCVWDISMCGAVKSEDTVESL